MNLASLFLDTAERQSDTVALRLFDTTFTYGAVAGLSARIAGLLVARGVRPGDRVGVMLPNIPPFAAIYYGVLRAGGVVVPMNPLLKAREVAYHLTDSGARLLFAWDGAGSEAQEGASRADGADVVTVSPETFPELVGAQEPVTDVVDRAGDDTAVILYTSGTTGQPKGAELTHANLTRNVEVAQSDLLQLSTDDIIFGGLPMFHSFGQTCALNAAMANGASVLLLPRFDAAAAADLLAKHHVTVFAGVPTMYAALLGLDDGPASPRPPPSRRSTGPATGARRGRSARRSPASRCRWSTATAARSPPARWARSRSAATTS